MTKANVATNDTSQERVDKTSEIVHEPVAWMFQHEETGRMMFVEAQQLEWGFEKGNPRLKKIRPVYTTPPQRKPLTDEEIGSCIDEVNLTSQYGHHHFGWHIQFSKAIEAAHGIKGEA